MASPLFDSDPVLARLERRALAFCGSAALVALAARGGRPDTAIAIVAGGLLSAVSYWAIRSGVSALTRLAAGDGAGSPAPPPGAAGTAVSAAASSERAARSAPSRLALLLRLTGRYALLGLMAYGMIARLRLSPIGLLIGMSSLVAAAAFEAIRPQRGRRDI